MPLSTRTTIQRNFKSALEEISGVTTVERNRKPAITAAEMPALLQFRGGEVRRWEVSGQDEASLTINVELLATGANDEAAEEALDDLLALLIAKLAEAANITLGGQAERVEYQGLTDPEINDEKGSPPFITATASFEVQFATAVGDPYTAS